MTNLPDFRMRFEPLTIDHLGLRLYSTLPPVISELVSNAWDAESEEVEVQIPKGQITSTSEVVVKDYGLGMSPQELADEYLPIGRPRRGPDDTHVMSKNGKRRVTGRKGLGKLSAFGVASEIEVRSIQNGSAVCLRLDYEKIKAWVKNHVKGDDYAPDVVQEKTGPTSERNGLSVTLRQLRRKSPMSPDDVRKGLARRLHMIGKEFTVRVNGDAIGPGDRVSRDQCEENFSWDIASIPGKGQIGKNNSVTGWIGFLPSSSQANRGIDIFAHKKAVELGSFFNYPSTHAQFARAHLVGEIHANFLDGVEDLASTARNSVVWESPEGQYLQSWGHASLKWAFDEWLKLRRKKKEEDIITIGGFDKWLKTRQDTEQKVARKMVKLLVDDAEIESSSAMPLLEIVKSSVETVAFRDLVEAIEIEGGTPQTLLKLFDEWRIIEAREHLKLADGRMAALEQLRVFIDTGALEVKEMQPLLEKNLWILDQAWTEALVQETYTDLLRKYAKESKNLPDSDLRIDIFALGDSKITTIVEIKRPEKTLSREDLEQIEKYVDWGRSNLIGTGKDSPTYIWGRLIIGKMNSNSEIAKKIERLGGDDIRVETYRDLYERSSKFYTEVERILQHIAPEYKSPRKRKGIISK